ncbi:MAG: acetyl-CoA carboxylase, carboxyltransferase subunit beta [Verrucomicrobia bacterium]|nr:acetyl-CoA carboxylase, carboxyltransferase subunit beta [Verrucomicrobiota bacterium]
MGIFSKPSFHSDKKREFPEGLWQKCPSCTEMIHNLDLVQNFRVCPKCDHHLTLSARDRIEMLLDPDSFQEHDAGLTSVDTLKFTGMASYTDRLKSYQKKTGLKDAVISGIGAIHSQPLAIAVMDFHFIAATMGSVVGEKLTRCVERATQQRIPVVIVAASGGARMYEGVLSLLQMAKTCGALALHSQARLPYISILTHPTTGGVSASFATVGDLILAEPRAMIGFAGPRVIKETTHQDLPPNFQTAEFLEDHGLVDKIVHRKQMRETLKSILSYLTPTQ